MLTGLIARRPNHWKVRVQILGGYTEMEIDTKPKDADKFPDKPNNILAIWKRLWPLIISVGLFVLMGVAWNQPVVYTENCKMANDIAGWVDVAANGTLAGLIVSRLISVSGTNRSPAAWVENIIYILAVYLPALVATVTSSLLVTDLDLRFIGVIGYIAITIVILVGRERKRPTRYQTFIWLSSLLILIITQYLARPLAITECVYDGFGALGADV
jgi:hypothetical protein